MRVLREMAWKEIVERKRGLLCETFLQRDYNPTIYVGTYT